MDAEGQVENFIARFSDGVAAEIRAARAEMRRRLPGAWELVYDNYNALVFGYGASARASDAVFSLACYPHWIRLFFLRGAGLDDPEGVLEGKGAQVRSLKLTSLARLEEPAVQALMGQALAPCPIDPAGAGRTIVKAISPKQRPRRA